MPDTPIHRSSNTPIPPYPDTPIRVLLCRLGGIGDVLHTLPLVKYLRKKYPESSIEYLTSPSVAELLESHCPFVNKVWRFDKKNKKEICRNILNGPYKIDYLFNLHSSLSFYFLNLFFIRAKKYFPYKKDNRIHAVINFSRTYDQSVSGFELDSKTLVERDCSDFLKKYNLQENKYICVVPGVGKSRIHRAWPFENWLNLTKKFLFVEKDFKIVFLGGEDEKKTFENKFDAFGNKAVNLIGELSLPETANIISKSVKVISCDTGLLHVAAAFSKSVVGLYGPTLPKRTGPFTSDYQILMAKDCKCTGGFRDFKKCKMTKLPKGFCMDSLTVDNVLANVCSELTNREIEVLS